MSDESWYKDVKMADLSEAQRAFAEVIGVPATLRLCAVYGGCTTHVPKNDTAYNNVVRNREIRHAYQLGASIRALTQRFGLSERQVLRITQGCAPQMISMFDDMDKSVK